MRGFGIQSTFGKTIDFMATDHKLRQESWLHQNQTAPEHRGVQVRKCGQEELDMEHQNLILLLKVFPGIPLHSIAEAYTRARGDPNYAAELLAWGSQSSLSADIGHRTEGYAVQKVYEDGVIFETSRKPLESNFHLEKIGEQIDEVEKQRNGSVVSLRGRGTHNNHSGRPPEVKPCGPREAPELVCGSACQSGLPYDSSVDCSGRNGTGVTSNSLSGGSVVGIAAGNYAIIGTGKTFFDSGSSLLPGWKGFSHGNKVSAISGTVSCHRQRRNGLSQHDVGKDSKDYREGDEVLFNGKQKKKKKKKAGITKNEDAGNPADSPKKQSAAEEFLHSMLGEGFELGVDVVRDVLEHFAGDINKALETLLHMASTSPGFHVKELSEQECDEDLVHTTNVLPQKDLVSKNNLVASDMAEHNFDHALFKLHEGFPTVEMSFLSQVLQASDSCYGNAVQAFEEAGMTPVNERASSKVDPAEVLHALFSTESPDNNVDACPSDGQQNSSEEYFTVVGGRARARRSASENTAVKDKVDEYEKHRGSANDHWTTMKRYFQEAAAAHGRGERALATFLSEKGQLFKGLAREASLRASETIFSVKNKDIENNITIDLHAQHVQEALRLLKLHLRSLSSISSVHTLTVITGYGSHSANGRARIKPALTQYLTRMQIPWVEPNAGCLIIKMSDVKAHNPAYCRSSESSSDDSQ